jgi:hypothetical protein
MCPVRIFQRVLQRYCEKIKMFTFNFLSKQDAEERLKATSFSTVLLYAKKYRNFGAAAGIDTTIFFSPSSSPLEALPAQHRKHH